MRGFGPSSWGGSCLPSYVLQQPVIATNSCLSPWLDIGPGPHILVLLLHPAQLGIAVLVSYTLHDVEGEGADLLDSVDGNLVLQSSVSSFLQEVVVDLTRTEKYLLD